MSDSDLPLQAQVDLWRQKSLAGTLTDEELRQAVVVMRAGRAAAASLGATRKSTRAPVRAAEDMLKDLLSDDDDPPAA